MKIPDKSDLKPTHQGLLAELLRASGNTDQTKESLFDEFSRTLDSIVTKLRKNNDSGQLPDTESRFAQDEKPKVDKKSKDSEHPIKEPKQENQESKLNSQQPLKTQSLDVSNEKEEVVAGKRPINAQQKDGKDFAKIEDRSQSNQQDLYQEEVEKLEDNGQEQTEQAQKDNNQSVDTPEVSVALLINLEKIAEPEKTENVDESHEKLADQSVSLEVTNQNPQEQLLTDHPAAKINNLESQKIEDLSKQKLLESEIKLEAPALSESNTITQAVVKESKTDEKDRSLEGLILEKLLVGQVDPKLQELASSKTATATGAIFDRVAQAISTNFAALAESVLLKNSAQNLAAKMPHLGAEIATQQAAQGLQTINPTGMLNGSKSADFADRRLDNKESMKSLPRSLEVRTMERVESALKEVARSKDGKTISVRLDPPELGTVKIDVTQRDGSIHARLVAESPQVNNLLKDKSTEVVQMLRKLGLNVDKVTVSVGGQSEQPSQQFNQQLDSQVNDRTGERENRNSSNRSRKEANGQSASASRVQHQNLNGVVSDHWVA